MSAKSYGTILRSNPIVNEQFKKFAISAPFKSPIPLPENFDGRVVWKNYLSPVRDQKLCGNCWACSTVDMLSDRYSILTLGQIKLQLSATEATICAFDKEGVFLPEAKSMAEAQQINADVHAQLACFGNSLYDSIKYLYVAGIPPSSCIDPTFRGKFKDLSLFNGDSSTLPVCEDIEGLDHDTCFGTEPMRVFRAGYISALVIDHNDGGSDESLKYAIFHSGPVAGGFDIMPSFLNEYDGKTIYKAKEGEKPSGGHAVLILGWGKENGVNYWLCKNSWGEEWGDKGYFKIQHDQCNLEKNCVLVLPDLPSTKVLGFASKPLPITQDLIDIRKNYEIDPQTFFPIRALKKIQKGILKGDLTPLFNPKYLLDRTKDNAGNINPNPLKDIPKLPPIVLNFKDENGYSKVFYISGGIFIVLLGILLVFYVVKNKNENLNTSFNPITNYGRYQNYNQKLF